MMNRADIPACCRAWAEGKRNWTQRERQKLLRLTEKYIDPVGSGWPAAKMDDRFRTEIFSGFRRFHATAETREILLGMLRDAAAELLRRGQIRYNPFLELPPVYREGGKYPALSDEEVGKLMSMDPRAAGYACMQVQLLTGMRPAEARGLYWEDVSEKDGIILVRHQLRSGKTEPVKGTKNYKSRKICPSDMAFDILREVRENGNGGNRGLVFTDPAGRPMNGRALGRLLKDTIGRENVRLHDLRVTHATMLYKGTGDLYRVARRLGHSGTDVTQKHYVDVRPDLAGARDAQNSYYEEVI